MQRNPHAQAAGAIAPTSDTAHVASAGRVEGNETKKRTEFGIAPQAEQAPRVIDGETKAAQYLARLHAEQADPDELAVIVSMLYGAALRGFCRVLAKAVGVRHG